MRRVAGEFAAGRFFPLQRLPPSPKETEQGCGFARNGVIAQLGERLNGIQEVGGSIPPGSTKILE
jgi:hypothetical protein